MRGFDVPACKGADGFDARGRQCVKHVCCFKTLCGHGNNPEPLLSTSPIPCRRAQWFAVLLGPFGCTLRWLLSQYNYHLPGAWHWLPAGTLAANMLGCLTDFIVGVRSPPCPRHPLSIRDGLYT